MTVESCYLLAADIVLALHVLFVAFVVVGLALVLVGKWLSWEWVTHFRFRLLHLAAVAIVVLQSWLGAACPLTLGEMQLRELGGKEAYGGSFVQYWLQAILYYEAPEWVFVLVYTVFGAVVVASWAIVPPKRRR
jgi:hypothetical protein